MLSEKEIISLLKPCLKKPFVLLETAVEDKENFTSFLFKDFTKVITFNYNDNLDFFFKQIEDCLKKKSWLCGFFSYEFGYFLEPALYHLRTKGKLPLAWLAATKNPQEIIPKAEKDFSCTKNNLQSLHIKNIRPNIDYNQYQAAIKKIKKYLANGTNYQTNFTFKIKFNFSGDILNFYLKLRKAQPTSYSALINTGDRFIVSLSPELFFRVNGNRITTRPMKGSLARGFTLTEDKIRQDLLKADKKIIAENLMIVDLLRNDLGRIAEKVWVPKLFTAEKYRTIHQMTSTIAAKLKENISLKSLFTALFPSGSVTGAPKIKTMQIINRLEKEPRGIYTGAIGYKNRGN
jgi:para-aminobenzoate synthetase/4-amino-4-deoxychorismate lyase